MVTENRLDAAQIVPVINSWEKIKQIPNFEAIVGEHVFRAFFELRPNVIKLFPFGKYKDNAALFASPEFKVHSDKVVSTFDFVITSLLDLDPEVLRKSGERHASFPGFHPMYFPALGQAVLYALECALEDLWNDKLAASWTIVFEYLAIAMTEGYNRRMKAKTAKPETKPGRTSIFNFRKPWATRNQLQFY